MRELSKQPIRSVLDLEVNRQMRLMSNHLKRDTFTHDRSNLCLDLVRAVPAKLRRQLGKDAFRKPYCVHAALAVLDSSKCEHLHDEYFEAMRGSVRELAPQVSREQRKAATSLYGPEAVQETIDFIARKLSARNRAFGTKGIYIRRFFLSQCAHYRATLNSTHQAPKYWENIVASLIEAQAIQPIAYHRSGAYNYPSFGFIGAGRRYVRNE